MSIEKILHYVGKIGYMRGKEYYTSGSIISYRETESEIVAVLKGTGKEKFTVKIFLDENRDVKASECTCPLWDRCKHIAAVLIHYYHADTPEEITIPASVNITAGRYNIYNLDYSGDADKAIKAIVHNIQHKYTAPLKENDSRTWKLFFRIKPVNFNGNMAANWEIAPVLRYLKKDGTWGSLYNYTPRKQISLLTPQEQAVLYRLLENEEHKDKFIFYIDLFIANPSLPLLLISGYRHYPVTIKTVTGIRIGFMLAVMEKRKIAFTPCLELFYDDNQVISTRDYNYYLFRYGTSLYCILENGMLLIRQSDIALITFITELHTRTLLAPDILFLQDFIHREFPGEIEIEFTTTSIKIITGIPEPVIEMTSDLTGNTHIQFKFKYDGRECSAVNAQNLLVTSINAKETTAIRRDIDSEKRLIHFFAQLVNEDMVQNPYGNSNNYLIRMSVTDFLVQYGTKLIDNGYSLIMGRNRKLTKSTGKLSLFLKSGTDWFDLEMKYRDNDGNLSDIKINEYELLAGVIQIKDKFILLDKSDIESLRKLQTEGIDAEGKLKISKLNFSFIEEFYNDIANNDMTADDIREIRKYRELYTKLIHTPSIPAYDIPQAYRGSLRNYQKEGYNWLCFLYKHNINGCLADDMGLGKTIQTLALLQFLKEKAELGHVLLVVPVTVLPNWEIEFRRFTTDITTIRHAGKNRSYDQQFLLQYDVILLSYHTLRIDIDFFCTFEFNYLILDESQNIKNAFTQTFRAIKRIKSGHRLALTGTPVENNTLELWSQMEFLNPGLLPGITDFKRNFSVPIEEFADKNASLKLKKIISPVILRRKKEEVITDLPEKEILVCYAEMHLTQRKAYNELKNYYQNEIKNIIRTKGVKRSRFEIFNAILRMRQMVLFPEIVSSDYRGMESCKFEALKEMLGDILAEDHKVLIFSQFVSVLQIIRNYLDKMQIQYCYMDGTTQKREQEITLFQENIQKKIFLLSLKAGGTGINLTAADYVILFDPWWNPAVEAQAIDRSHRIGQEKKVIAYKMIVRNSIEEKIMNLQNKKAELVNKIISEDRNVFKFLSEDDIIQLFQ